MPTKMILYPAIDIKDGRVVRLLQGKADQETVYYNDPVIPAEQYKAAGSTWVHVVDLDGAFTGKADNWESIRRIADTGLKVEMGGGLRDDETIRKAFECGVSRVVIGTKAIGADDFLKALTDEFGDKIAVGIDAKDGKVAIHGWVSTTDTTAIDLARHVASLGVKTIIYTDISRDGMLIGPNFEGQKEMMEKSGCEIIASGGVSSIDDIVKFKEMYDADQRLNGVIIGKAIYDKKLDLVEALKLC